MKRFSLDDMARAQPADVAMIATTTDAVIAAQIAADPDTAPDLGDAEPASFVVVTPA